MVKIGIVDGSDGILYDTRCYIGIDKGSQIILNGNLTMAPGATLKAIRGGVISIGSGCTFNFHCTILSKEKISIGNDVMFGWNVLINDGDGHKMIDIDGRLISNNKAVVIRDGAWIGANATLLKGCIVGKGCVVGYQSLLTKSFDKPHIIIAGNPGRVIKENVTWEK